MDLMSSAPEMPLDLRLLMQECILALFWPKKKIAEFLLSVGTPAGLVAASDATTTRYELVADVFSKLSARPDRGFVAFQTMLDRLSNWTHFDSYYFDTLKKLDRAQAQACIAGLKAAVSTRNDATERRRTAAETSQRKRRTTADLGALTAAFGKLFGTSMTPQARGYSNHFSNSCSTGMASSWASPLASRANRSTGRSSSRARTMWWKPNGSMPPPAPATSTSSLTR
jgi:hypothetical protein